jgi:hypothetical protein
MSNGTLEQPVTALVGIQERVVVQDRRNFDVSIAQRLRHQRQSLIQAQRPVILTVNRIRAAKARVIANVGRISEISFRIS